MKPFEREGMIIFALTGKQGMSGGHGKFHEGGNLSKTHAVNALIFRCLIGHCFVATDNIMILFPFVNRLDKKINHLKTVGIKGYSLNEPNRFEIV